MQTIRTLCIVGCAMLVAACGKGLDRSPDFSSNEAFRAAVATAGAEMTAAQAEAYDWAVSDQTFNSLQQKYKGKTFREIGLLETEAAIRGAQEKLAQLQPEKERFDAITSELQKVTAETSDAKAEKDRSFGGFDQVKFFYKMRVKNGSKYDFSTLEWKLTLYLNGESTPAATAKVYDFYEREGGLKSGQEALRQGKVDSFSNSDWVTLTVQNARERYVKAELVDAKDFSNQSLVKGSPYAEIDKMQRYKALAEKHHATLSAKQG